MLVRSILACVLFVLGAVGFAHGAQRTFVSGHGLDSNLCTLTAPCRSFGTAISQTTVGGEVIVLDSAGYGPVTIGGSISLIAPSGVYAGVSVSSGDGITINASGGTVVLRGLSINGVGGSIGITVNQVARLRIEGCTISNMNSNGVADLAQGSDMTILDTVVRDNGGTGIGIAADSSVVLDHVRSEHNFFDGFYIQPASVEATATIVDSVFVNNGVSGIWIDTHAGANTYTQVERSTIAGNGHNGLKATASLSAAQANVILARNAINRNGENGVLLSGMSPGFVFGQLTGNAMQSNKSNGIFASGAGVIASASANTVGGGFGPTADFKCDDSSGRFFSHGNNDAATFLSVGSCLMTIGLF
jgi:hypothetical protein